MKHSEFIGHAIDGALIVGAFALGLVMGSSPGQSQEAAPDYTVEQNVVCTLPVARAVATILTKTDLMSEAAQSFLLARVGEGVCVTAPQMHWKILAVDGGPVADVDSDVFYVVKLGEGAWTWAWPGFNSDLPNTGDLTETTPAAEKAACLLADCHDT